MSAPDHPTWAIVLAAGLGTRMRSKVPKVLHRCAGKPLLLWSVEAAAKAGARPIVVLSPESEAARGVLPPGTAVAIQSPMRGTGDAVRAALAATDARDGDAFVVYADTPTVRAETLERLRSLRVERGAVLALLTAQLAPNETGEVFLTDLVAVAVGEGKTVAAHCTPDPSEGVGVNTRVELAATEAILRARIRERLMLAGVTFHDPTSSQVDDTVTIATDTVIEPGCILEGTTAIGPDTRIGPYSILRDTTVGARCIVEASVLEGATLEDDVRIGPFSHLRPGAYLEQGVGMGNFGEVKAARLRKGAKMHHFSYVGDADVGERVTIGARTITMNYDGVNKHHTTIGNDAFIGSDTLLRAPITVGEGAVTGAGSVVTKDVAPGMLAVGVPARQIKKATKPERKRRS